MTKITINLWQTWCAKPFLEGTSTTGSRNSDDTSWYCTDKWNFLHMQVQYPTVSWWGWYHWYHGRTTPYNNSVICDLEVWVKAIVQLYKGYHETSSKEPDTSSIKQLSDHIVFQKEDPMKERWGSYSMYIPYECELSSPFPQVYMGDRVYTVVVTCEVRWPSPCIWTGHIYPLTDVLY